MNDNSKTQLSTDHASPYPVSRLSPAFGLLDLAREIAQADEILADRAGAQLQQIAEQVRQLQQQAQTILRQTRRDQQLHRARCNFQKKPGQIYHLYRDRQGEDLLSLLSPEDWRGSPPYTYLGSYRLQSDRSWTPLEQA
jgi:hypothetical protein